MIAIPALLTLVPIQAPQATTPTPVLWLVSHQEADGRWDARRGSPQGLDITSIFGP